MIVVHIILLLLRRLIDAFDLRMRICVRMELRLGWCACTMRLCVDALEMWMFGFSWQVTFPNGCA